MQFSEIIYKRGISALVVCDSNSASDSASGTVHHRISRTAGEIWIKVLVQKMGAKRPQRPWALCISFLCDSALCMASGEAASFAKIL